MNCEPQVSHAFSIFSDGKEFESELETWCNDRRKDTESAKHNLFIPVEQRQQNFKMASYKLGHVTRKAGTRLVLHVTILVTSPFLSLIV